MQRTMPRPSAPPATLWSRFRSSMRSALSSTYDAVRPSGRRRNLPGRIKSEDATLKNRDRRVLQESVDDLMRNFSVVQWAIDAHLTWVCDFEFYSTNSEHLADPDGDADGNGLAEIDCVLDGVTMPIDAAIEAMVEEWSDPEHNDVRGQLSLSDMLRLVESEALRKGDCGLIKLADGRLQAIESDRWQSPPEKTDSEKWVHGVRVDKAGKPIAYGLFNRGKNGVGYEYSGRNIAARNVLWHTYVWRIDQTRGTSPLASAVNMLCDARETMVHTQTRVKLEQYFGLVLTRKSEAPVATVYEDDYGDPEDDEPETPVGGATRRETTDGKQHTFEFGDGPQLLDLGDDEDAKFLTTDAPGSNFFPLMKMALMIALRSIGLSYSMLDETDGKFHGNRAAWLAYEQMCLAKRRRLAAILRRITRWRLSLAVLSGRLVLPVINGRQLTVKDLAFEWTHRGMPWWKPQDEVAGDISAVGAGFASPQRVTKSRGQGSVYRILRERQRVEKYAEKLGVVLQWSVPEPQTKVTVNASDN